MNFFGAEAIIRIISHFTFIILAFWGMQSLRLDQMFKRGYERQARMFFSLMSIVIGYISSTCILEIIVLFKNFIVGITN